MIEVQLTGYAQAMGLYQALGNSTPILNEVLKNWADNTVRRHLKGMKMYPEELPNQKYKRTGNLGDGWRARNPRKGEVQIVNVTPYSPEVIGERQLPIHQGRWPLADVWLEERANATLGDTAERLLTRLVASYDGNTNRWRSAETGQFISATEVESRI